jgi:hypothetical protein
MSRCDVAQVFPGSLDVARWRKHFLFLVFMMRMCMCMRMYITLFCVATRTHSTVPSASAYHWPRRLEKLTSEQSLCVNVECSAVETYCGTTVKRTSI